MRSAHTARLQPAALTLWLTGLSGAGKSTLADALAQSLLASGRACYVLDGDQMRQGLNNNLGFSATDRRENIRRVAEVARLMNAAGLIVITALISPSALDRAMAKEIIGAACFREVFISTALSVCESRDVKGLYQQARAGKLLEFTGISAPYETPTQPDLVLDTATHSVENAVLALQQLLVHDAA
ncbi:MAG: adenylyl-sulfate kinase [Pseudomonadota bacterium]